MTEQVAEAPNLRVRTILRAMARQCCEAWERRERMCQADWREGCRRAMRNDLTPATWHRSPLEGTGDESQLSWTPKEIP
jgi:hypothetical protein